MTDSKPDPWAWLERPAPHHRAYANGGFWRDETLADMAYRLTETNPDASVLANVAGPTRRGEIIEEAEALAVSLQELGLKPGDVISFQIPNWAEACVINLAAAMGGFVINPIVPIYRDAEVGMMLRDCGAKVLFVPQQYRRFDFAAMAARLRSDLPALEHIVVVRGSWAGMLTYDGLIAGGRGRGFSRSKVDPRDVKMLLYTSGTTGRPKGVLHSHNTLTRAVACGADHWGIQPGDPIIMPSPVTHVSGYSNGLELPFISETITVLMEAWDAADAVSLIETHGVVGTVAATPFLTELSRAANAAGTRLPSLRFFACGGAAVPDEVIPAANAAFENAHAFRVFGSSEVPLVTLGFPGGDSEMLAATTDGEIIDYEVRVVDAHDNELAAGEEGEILARGPAMFLGYADKDQTEEAITPDGFFRTGDLGVRTVDNAIIITGRKKDLIIRGGENISAREIEDVLHAHPGVTEAAVIAMPHARLGEGVCAYIIPDGALRPDASALTDHVAASGLAKQKIPERFEFVEDFPRTPSGKIRKDLLRKSISDLIEQEAKAG